MYRFLRNEKSFCFLLLTLLAVLKGSLQCETEEKLFQKLLARYNQHIRPVENVSDPVMVHFEVAITQLVNVDEVNQILETNLWLRHIWNDYKLQWNPEEYDGIEFMRIPADKIWKPDIVLYNKTPTTHKMPMWVKDVFLKRLPKLLMMKKTVEKKNRPYSKQNRKKSCEKSSELVDSESAEVEQFEDESCYHCMRSKEQSSRVRRRQQRDSNGAVQECSSELTEVVDSIQFMAGNIRDHNERKEEEDDWKYVAMVIDRVFLWVFILLCVVGTTGLFLQPMIDGN
ncbi:neuronal acetylcholine receptor subunit alpha-6 isoform X2 [Xenopus tropicalis]|uniref:Neuronal acetylcholine receptor subunit alpha-6 isoform X2 n=1 Tax=Xenopus tropicalis TaxID=8364 RepID=A0A8J1JN00_XENTR|nr:neuronal acetylcholine receptor subunit alpha-6 isoform X2 [Xenopus tropicalis]